MDASLRRHDVLGSISDQRRERCTPELTPRKSPASIYAASLRST